MNCALHHCIQALLLQFPGSVLPSQNEGCNYIEIILLRVYWVVKFHCLEHLTFFYETYERCALNGRTSTAIFNALNL
jgi:hypothetical protein